MPEFAPLDYTSAFQNVPSPIQSFNEGIKSGFVLQRLQLQQQMQRYEFARKQQMQAMSAQVAQNPTPENITQLSIAFPEMSEQFKRSYDMMAPQQQRADLQHMTGVYAALQSGRPDVAAQLLRDRATALKNSGASPMLVNASNAMADWAEQHPDTLKTSAGVLLASVMGPDKFSQAFKDITEGQTAQETMPAKVAEAGAKASQEITTAQMAPRKQATDVAKTQADITNLAGRLALDRDKLLTDAQLKLKELSLQYGTPAPEAAKLINDSAMSAAAGEQSAARLTDMANRMEDADRTTGGAGTAAEAWKKANGGGDGVTALKQEYARIVNNQAISGMKDALGGRVTDVDMKTAMGAVPDANASATVVASYLRGVAKLQVLDAARQQAQAEWLSQAGHNAHLGPAKQDMTIMGTKVPAGTSFADFSRQFLQQKAEQITAQGALARAAGKSYMRFATPPQTGGATGSY